ncbi:MAG: DUF2804 domain-containing protein [Candidatus Hydrogenedentes bacterium]|nr:DUF2804 domain-containing protein [Candidatus Hydrogenedentota bacterium]
MEEERKVIPLCLANGRLNPEATKWMSYPFVNCNLYGWGRRKKWIFWGIMSRQGTLGVTIADLDYLKLGGIYFANFNNNYSEELGKIAFTSKSISIPDFPLESARFSNPDLNIDIRAEESKISLDIDGEIKKKHIHGSFAIHLGKLHPTLNVVVPWSRKRFQFTSKQLPYLANGYININNVELNFTENTCFACLDYGAGKWKYRTNWNWLAGSTLEKSIEERIGINLGGKWTDNTGQNENGIWEGNKFTKISEDVTFIWNRQNPEKKWLVRSKNSDNIELTLEPTHVRKSKINLILLKSEVVQVFGEIKGEIKVNKDIITIDSMIGWAEEHCALW